MVYIHIHRDRGENKRNGILENALIECMNDDILDEIQLELQDDDDDDPDFYFPDGNVPMPKKPVNE